MKLREDFYEILGNKIKNYRKKQNLSQKDLAEHLGKESATYINLIESGKRRISLDNLVKIGRKLEIPMNLFLDDDYQKHDSESLINLGLISDSDLSSEQRQMVLDFIKFVKNK